MAAPLLDCNGITSRYLISFLTLLFGWLRPSDAEAAEPDFNQIGQFVEDAVEELDIPGAALAIVHQGEIVYLHAWGETGGDRQPVTTATPFTIGSNSKALTAYAVMRLIEQGKVELNAPVTRYLPQFRLRNSAGLPPITVWQLLCHHSGISAESGFRIADLAENDPQALQRSVERLADEELSAKPGATYQYSAANYAVLGAIVERVSGQSFARFMGQQVFAPLGMAHAAADQQTAEERGWQPGYRSWFGLPVASKVPFDNAGAPYGYMAASAEDMAHFLIALQRPGAALAPQETAWYLDPLAPASELGAYGFGWRISGTRHNLTKIWHAGSTADFRSEVFLLPEKGWGVALLTNRNNALESAALRPVALGIEAMLLGDAPPPVVAPTLTLRAYGIAVVLALVGLLTWVGWSAIRDERRAHPWLWNVTGTASLAGGVALVPGAAHLLHLPLHTLFLTAPDLSWLVVLAAALLSATGLVAIFHSRPLQGAASPASHPAHTRHERYLESCQYS